MRFRLYTLIALSILGAIANEFFNIDLSSKPVSIAIEPAPARVEEQQGERSGNFDFYVLALSWSPSYCEAEGTQANPMQCEARQPHAFVVHGLWPQFEKGYPSRCATRLNDRVPNALAHKMVDIMPSFGLIGHQWRKHGTCSGLDQQGYFAMIRAAFDKVQVPAVYRNAENAHNVNPDKLEREFIALNQGLTHDGIATTCQNNLLREVRICLTKDLQFRSCEEVNKRACSAKNTVMPAASGQ